MFMPRTAQHITRWVLMWFALSLGAAVASPVLTPQTSLVVCTSAGLMTLVTLDDNHSVELGSHSLDCPLCAALAAPPPVVIWGAEPPFDLAFACQPHQTVRLASVLRGLWQARAPPVLS
jgi:hypothetical protein